jgi:hypothetical protein
MLEWAKHIIKYWNGNSGIEISIIAKQLSLGVGERGKVHSVACCPVHFSLGE